MIAAIRWWPSSTSRSATIAAPRRLSTTQVSAVTASTERLAITKGMPRADSSAGSALKRSQVVSTMPSNDPSINALNPSGRSSDSVTNTVCSPWRSSATCSGAISAG